MSTVRPALEDDCAAIAAITNHAIETGVAHFGTEPEDPAAVAAHRRREHTVYPWLVAADDAGAVLGFSRATPWKPRAAYAWTCEAAVYVRPDARGRGLGRSLYQALFGEIERRGFRCIVAGVTIPNPPSERLHLSMGMREAGLLPMVGFKHGAWRDVRYYVKVLGSGDPPGASPRDQAGGTAAG